MRISSIKKVMNHIRKLDKFIAGIEGWIVISILGLLTLFSALDVAMGVFGSGLGWINRFFGYAMLWLALSGASLATHEQRHINIDIFSRILPLKAKQAILFIIHLLGVWICFVFAREAFEYILEVESPAGEKLFSVGFDIYNWMLYVVIPAAFMMMTLRFFIAALNDFLFLAGIGGEPPKEVEPISESFKDDIERIAVTKEHWRTWEDKK
ncbi:MAG: hypothetical protein Kow0090_23290 [Myxococcota bacterium]